MPKNKSKKPSKESQVETETPPPVASNSEELLNLKINQASDAGLPEHRELDNEESDFFRGLLEAILFLADQPLTLNNLARKCELDRVNTRILVDSLVDDYAERDGGLQLREIAGGYQFITAERYSEAMKTLYNNQKRETLSRSTLETLSIISYKQPITLPEIDEIRGANSRTMINTLLQRKLIKPQGYKPVPGRPTLYVTTRQFLAHFAISSLSELPTLEEVKELKFDEIN